MTEVPVKFAFPLFTKHNSTDYLIKHEQIRVSDLWAFWQYIIGRYIKKYSGERHFLQTLIDQSRYFYEAAEVAPIKSQPLLYYYSFLNLVKVVINVNSLTAYGSSTIYNHGVDAIGAAPNAKLKDLKVKVKNLVPPRPVPNQPLSVDFHFMSQMGDRFAVMPVEISIDEMLKACIGIHRTYCETNNCKETYYKIEGLKLYKHGHSFITSYEITHCDDAVMAALAAAGYTITKEVDADGLNHYYWQEQVYMLSNAPTKLDYYMLSVKLKEKGLWYFTDGRQYKKYISTDPLHYSTESIIYNLMFFFGSITRYHPYLFDEMLTEQQMWLVSEFLKTQPKQFLHIVTSKTIESAILKPDTANILF